MFDSGHLYFKISGSWKCEKSEMEISVWVLTTADPI